MEMIFALINETQENEPQAVESLITTAIKNALHAHPQGRKASDTAATSSNHLATTSSPSHGSHGKSLTSTELHAELAPFPETLKWMQQSMQVHYRALLLDHGA